MLPNSEYAIYAEQTESATDRIEMKPDLANRIFNTIEIESPGLKSIGIKSDTNCEQIGLMPGTYRISGTSIITMLTEIDPVSTKFLVNTYPGYCILYRTNNPPSLQDMSGTICLGTMGTAYDTGPSTFDCVYTCTEPQLISLAHQCTYDNPKHPFPKVFLRFPGSKYHVCARISIFKIA